MSELNLKQSTALFIQGFNYGTQTFLELTSQAVKNALLVADADTTRDFAEKLRKQAVALKRTKDFTAWYNDVLKAKNKERQRTAPDDTFLPEQLHKTFDFGDYGISDRGLSYFNERTGDVYFCKGTPCYISKILTNADGDGVKYEITYKVDHKWRTIVFAKDILSDKAKILQLATTDISVSSGTSTDLVKFIEDFVAANRDKIPRSQSIGRFGWINTDFVPYLDDFEFDGTIDEVKKFKAMHVAGSFEAWRTCTNEAMAQRSVRFSIAASVASPLLEVISSQMFITHLWGETEIGKTVSLYHAMSVWGEPKELCNFTFNGTPVGLEMIARFYKHCCMPINELQAMQSKFNDFGTMIFNLCEGSSKLRGAKNGGLRKQDFWNMIILSNGNQPLNEENSQAGAINRVIEIYEDKALYKNPKAVCDTIFDNYGHAGKLIIDHIKKERLKFKTYHKQCIEFLSSFNGYKGTDKHRNALAVLMLGDIVYSQAVNGTAFERAFSDTKQFIKDNADIFKSVEEIKLSVRSYDHIRSWVAQNKGYFGKVSDGNDIYNNDKVYGLIDKDEVLWLLPTAFDEWAKLFGISKRAVLAEWRQSGKLICGSGNEKRTKRKGELYYKIALREDKGQIKLSELTQVYEDIF